MLALSAPGRINAQDDVITGDTATLSVVFVSSASWSLQKTALLYRDASGNIASEIPLTRSEEAGATRLVAREASGGVSDNGRFAYVFDKTITWNAAKTKALKTQSFLRVLGTDGKTLWESVEADAPEGAQPLHFSADGETALVLLRRANGWTASLRYYLGAAVMEAGPFARIESARLTKNGRYAMIKWLVPDQSATHTFLDVKTKARKDIPSGELTLGAARLDEEGRVFSGGKLVFDFNAPPPKP